MHDLSSPEDNEPPPQPVPTILHSEYTDSPFTNCTRCGEGLQDFPGGYQISKAWKRGECVFEYALCDHCRMGLMEEFSKESKQRLANFEHDHVSYGEGMDACAVCHCKRTDMKSPEMVLTGVCDGGKLLHSLMICENCAEKSRDLLSEQTKDTWRKFRDENFPGPPGDEVFDLDPSPPLLEPQLH
jgi:hypothetical protein